MTTEAGHKRSSCGGRFAVHGPTFTSSCSIEMTLQAIDEIEAFRIATAAAVERRWSWRPPFWLDLSDGEWSVRSECEFDVRIDAASGAVRLAEAPLGSLDPAQALTLAREFARQNDHAWKPSFALELTSTHWIVGARQSQFGGQLTINVSHHGVVTSCSVNPK